MDKVVKAVVTRGDLEYWLEHEGHKLLSLYEGSRGVVRAVVGLGTHAGSSWDEVSRLSAKLAPLLPMGLTLTLERPTRLEDDTREMPVGPGPKR